MTLVRLDRSARHVDIPAPKPAACDLLVRVKAISVNPVDSKVRSSVKQELSALDKDQRRQVTAFLVSLQDAEEPGYRERLAKKIDQPASKFATLEEMDRRLKLTDDQK